MRVVAREAFTLFKRAMKAVARTLLHQLVVTFDAKLRIDFESLEKIASVRTVAVMTRYAIASPHRSMHIGLQKLILELRVAGITDPVRPVDEDGANIGPMRIVAIGARLLLKGSMEFCELLPLLLRL
jgi:hypothetical protein